MVTTELWRTRILALATDLPKLWGKSTTPDRERKRMVRLVIEDITLRKGTQVTADVRFRGGATTTLTVPRALSAWELRQTNPKVISEIDELLNDHTESQIAEILNERGYESGTGKAFTQRIVWLLRTEYKLRPRYDRLRAAGMLDKAEIGKRLRVLPETIKVWRRAGLLKAHAYNDKQYLYEPPATGAPVRNRRKGIEDSKRRRRLAAKTTEEVQYEA